MIATDAAPAPPGERPAEVAHRRRVALVDAAIVAAVTLLALVLRVGPLGPSSLWLDDAWVALVHRTEDLTEARFIGSSAPGFVLALRAWLGLVGFSERSAQLLPLAAGVVAPGLAYLLARRFRWERAAAALAALVLATSPVAVDYATRVKQYTTESVLAVGVLAVAWFVLGDSRSARRWALLVGLGMAAMAVSTFLALYVAAGIAAGLVQGWRQHDRTALRRAAAAGGIFGVLAGAWYVLVLAPTIPASLTGFWSGSFLVLDEGPVAAVASLGRAGGGVARGLVDLPAALVVGAVVVGAVAVARRTPELAVLLATPAVIAVVLAGLERAPLGGGRTDLYLAPTFALLLAGGVDAVLRALPGWVGLGALAPVAVALLLVARPAEPYPVEDTRALVAEVDRRAADGDGVLLYPASMWAYGLYTTDAVAIEAEASSAWGFAPRFAREATFTLPPGRSDPSVYAPTVVRLGAEVDQVWLLASHWSDDYTDLQAQLGAVGFERVEVLSRQGAELSRWRLAR